MKYFTVALFGAGILLAFGYLHLSPFTNTAARDADGTAKTTSRDGRTIEYYVQGTGLRVVLLASAGRAVSDFNQHASALVDAGYKTVAVEAPGIGRSDLPEGDHHLYDLGSDARAVIDADGGEPTSFFIGHAFGNRVARATSLRYEKISRGVILLAAGGYKPVPKKAEIALKNLFNPGRFGRLRLADLKYAFFADGNEPPDDWRRGWHIDTALLQGAASGLTPDKEWRSGGTAPMLVVQPAADAIAPKEDAADPLKANYPDRVTVALAENAGHALLPEQPDLVAGSVIAFLTAYSSE
ncbi:MAG: alpha/beta hydrolase [Marinicaulis sp.]|nr:alpha/beta hydrolase [Marinicaulis sp.]